MPTKSLGKLRSTEEVVDFLRAAGIEPDLRQEGWSLAFATFPIQDVGFGNSLSNITSKLKDHFIAHAPSLTYSSDLDGILFSPMLSEMLPPSKPLTVSHRRSSKSVNIRVRLDPVAWRGANTAQRRRMLVSALVLALEKVRPAWLSEADRSALSQLLASFAGTKLAIATR